MKVSLTVSGRIFAANSRAAVRREAKPTLVDGESRELKTPLRMPSRPRHARRGPMNRTVVRGGEEPTAYSLRAAIDETPSPRATRKQIRCCRGDSVLQDAFSRLSSSAARDDRDVDQQVEQQSARGLILKPGPELLE